MDSVPLENKLIKRQSNIDQLQCPFCKNPNIFIKLDFKAKWKGRDNFGVCIKKVEKGLFGTMKIVGCAKEFKIEIQPRKPIKFPSL